MSVTANPSWRVKTKPCQFHKAGRCIFGEDRCNFLHTQSEWSLNEETLIEARAMKAPTVKILPETPPSAVFASIRSPPRSPKTASLLLALKDVIGSDDEEYEEDDLSYEAVSDDEPSLDVPKEIQNESAPVQNNDADLNIGGNLLPSESPHHDDPFARDFENPPPQSPHTGLLSPVDFSDLQLKHLSFLQYSHSQSHNTDRHSFHKYQDSGFYDSVGTPSSQWVSPSPMALSPPRSPALSSTFELLSFPLGSPSSKIAMNAGMGMMSPRIGGAFVPRIPESPSPFAQASFFPDEEPAELDMTLDSPTEYHQEKKGEEKPYGLWMHDAEHEHRGESTASVAQIPVSTHESRDVTDDNQPELDEDLTGPTSRWDSENRETAVFIGKPPLTRAQAQLDASETRRLSPVVDEAQSEVAGELEDDVRDAWKRSVASPLEFLDTLKKSPLNLGVPGFTDAELQGTSSLIHENDDTIDVTAKLAYLSNSPEIEEDDELEAPGENDTLNSLYDVYSDIESETADSDVGGDLQETEEEASVARGTSSQASPFAREQVTHGAEMASPLLVNAEATVMNMAEVELDEESDEEDPLLQDREEEVFIRRGIPSTPSRNLTSSQKQTTRLLAEIASPMSNGSPASSLSLLRERVFTPPPHAENSPFSNRISPPLPVWSPSLNTSGNHAAVGHRQSSLGSQNFSQLGTPAGSRGFSSPSPSLNSPSTSTVPQVFSTPSTSGVNPSPPFSPPSKSRQPSPDLHPLTKVDAHHGPEEQVPPSIEETETPADQEFGLPTGTPASIASPSTSLSQRSRSRQPSPALKIITNLDTRQPSPVLQNVIKMDTPPGSREVLSSTPLLSSTTSSIAQDPVELDPRTSLSGSSKSGQSSPVVRSSTTIGTRSSSGESVSESALLPLTTTSPSEAPLSMSVTTGPELVRPTSIPNSNVGSSTFLTSPPKSRQQSPALQIGTEVDTPSSLEERLSSSPSSTSITTIPTSLSGTEVDAPSSLEGPSSLSTPSISTIAAQDVIPSTSIPAAVVSQSAFSSPPSQSAESSPDLRKPMIVGTPSGSEVLLSSSRSSPDPSATLSPPSQAGQSTPVLQSVVDDGTPIRSLREPPSPSPSTATTTSTVHGFANIPTSEADSNLLSPSPSNSGARIVDLSSPVTSSFEAEATSSASSLRSPARKNTGLRPLRLSTIITHFTPVPIVASPSSSTSSSSRDASRASATPLPPGPASAVDRSLQSKRNRLSIASVSTSNASSSDFSSSNNALLSSARSSLLIPEHVRHSFINDPSSSHIHGHNYDSAPSPAAGARSSWISGPTSSQTTSSIPQSNRNSVYRSSSAAEQRRSHIYYIRSDSESESGFGARSAPLSRPPSWGAGRGSIDSTGSFSSLSNSATRSSRHNNHAGYGDGLGLTPTVLEQGNEEELDTTIHGNPVIPFSSPLGSARGARESVQLQAQIHRQSQLRSASPFASGPQLQSPPSSVHSIPLPAHSARSSKRSSQALIPHTAPNSAAAPITPRPALLFAIASDDPEEVQRVLERNAAVGGKGNKTSVDVNDAIGPQSESALAFTLANEGLKNKLGIVKVLLGHGADPGKAKLGTDSESNVAPSADSPEIDAATRYYLSRAEAPLTRRIDALMSRSAFRPLARARYKLIGQDRALEQLFRVLSIQSEKISKAPIVVFLCGPSGHGKTLLAHQFGSLLDVPIHTVNMTTLRSADDLWRSYSISSSEDTAPCTLVEFLANNEGRRCVVVLDEIEKTELKALWTLLVPWELGRCTFEANSRNIDVRNVIWVGTSNIGNDMILEYHGSRKHPEEMISREEYVELMGNLRPRVSDQLGASVLSRVSAILPFVPFTREEQIAIAAEFLHESAAEHLVQELSKEKKEMIVNGALGDFVPSEGARSLYRAVSNLLVDSLDL